MHTYGASNICMNVYGASNICINIYEASKIRMNMHRTFDICMNPTHAQSWKRPNNLKFAARIQTVVGDLCSRNFRKRHWKPTCRIIKV